MTKPGLFRRGHAGIEIDRRGCHGSIGTIKIDGRMYPFGPVGPRDCGSGALLFQRRTMMTKIASMTPPIARGTIIGKQTGGPPLDERSRFRKCESCGGFFDLLDLGWVESHEGPLPHPAEDQRQ